MGGGRRGGGGGPQMPVCTGARRVLHFVCGAGVLLAIFFCCGPMVCVAFLFVTNRLGFELLPLGDASGQRIAAVLANHDVLPKPVKTKTVEDVENEHLRVGVCAMQGWRREMEDAHTALLRLSTQRPTHSFFGVYDGHCGDVVAKWAKKNLHRYVEDSHLYQLGDYPGALRKGMLRADGALKEKLAPLLPNPPLRPGGSTAVTLLVEPDADGAPSKVHCGNIGDSRCVLARGGAAIDLSRDHKPGNPEEERRIVRANGFVHMNRVRGQLAMSRALGDFTFKCSPLLPADEQMVSALPDVRTETVCEADEFVVLACDGIWDCRSSSEVVAFVSQRMKAAPKAPLSSICAELFDAILSKEPCGVGCDNMSMMVVQFKHRPKETVAEAADEK